jgi:hypothetical protein
MISPKIADRPRSDGRSTFDLAQIVVPIPPGELIDKITILKLKVERFSDPTKVANVRRELDLLNTERQRCIPADKTLAELEEELYTVNGEIWELEDAIRDREARSDFGEEFVATARQIYKTNDHRARLKRQINLLLGSELLEEKSYR